MVNWRSIFTCQDYIRPWFSQVFNRYDRMAATPRNKEAPCNILILTGNLL